MARNPFGDDDSGGRINPFGDEDDPAADPVRRIEQAASTFRNLRSAVGAEGMTGTGMRQVLDELSVVMRELARALRQRSPDA